jgi:primosomal protein N''
MKWFFWQKNRAVEAFARALADDLSSYLQPEVLAEHLAGIAGADNKKKTAKAVGQKKAAARSLEVQHRLAEMILRVQQFKAVHSLGVYRKARLHQVFENRLVELGYPAELAQEVNRLILLQTP